jgi:excisionase family DNA binding protein
VVLRRARISGIKGVRISGTDKGEFEPLLDSESTKIQSDRTAILALPDDAILTLSEVAAWLKLHPKTVSQMAREHHIPATTLPLGSKRKQFRFVKGAVGKWLSSAVVSSLTLVVPSQKGAKQHGTTFRLTEG